MSRAVEFEKEIARSAKSGEHIPQEIPDWMRGLGIQPGAVIERAERIGSKDSKNKTDVLIILKDSPPLKISVKLSSADYFGNWYSHKRIVSEFGNEVFHKLTYKITEWANNWACNSNASLFVGVSICFGRRSGNTSIPFLDIFDETSELLKIIAGVGTGNQVANCLYSSNLSPKGIEDVIKELRPINQELIAEKGNEIKVVCRPINPKTEGSNRGKNTYTIFLPHQALPELRVVEDLSELMKLGKFVRLAKADGTNHNRVLNGLEKEYNIFIPRK